MADLYGLEASGLPPELAAQLGSVQGQKKIAEAMLRAGMSPIQVQSGNISATQGIAQILNAYLGRKGIEKSDTAAQGIAQKRQQMGEDAMSEYMKTREGGTKPFVADTFPGEAQPEGLSTVVPGNPRAAIAKALQSRLPEVMAMANFDLKADETRNLREDQQKFQSEQAKAAADARAADRAAQNQMQMERIKMEIASRERLGQDANDLKRELAAMNAALRRDVAMAGVEAKKEAANAKQAEAKDKQAQGIEAVSDLASTMKSYYDDLDKAGAITSTKRGTLGNIAASVATSGPGQLVGRAVGTKEQSLRDSITQSRPLLLNAIREATGMSAKALDSNAELQLFLRSATDPALGYEANLRALQNIENFITKKGKTPMAPDGAPMPKEKRRKYNPETGMLE